MTIPERLARDFQVPRRQVDNVIRLVDEGNTVPFIARYRKEATGILDDQRLREIVERLEVLRGVDKRRAAIERSLAETGALTEALSARLAAAETLTELEDLYRPFKPKRHTRAMVARARGLEPLALLLLDRRPASRAPEALAGPFVCPEREVPDTEAALAGARDIIAERLSDDADARRLLRGKLWATALLETKSAREGDSVYRLYDAFSEPVRKIPAYRVLAINRGEREGWLTVRLARDDGEARRLLAKRAMPEEGARGEQVRMAAADAWDRLLFPSLERELRAALTDRAEDAALRVFRDNLRALLMQPPVKAHVTLGVDPGFRTGCKLAVVDASGKPLETGVGYFTIPGQDRAAAEAKRLIEGMVRRHGVTAIAIGNGTASREAERFIAALLPDLPAGVRYIVVSEAGASVYSASRLAAAEFPALDVSLRGAVSIARRMQDPLAELVKVDPRALGVGQYQHDVKETRLAEALGGVVEACVNSVGVEVSTASAALLAHVAGVGPRLAQSIVEYRDAYGLPSRASLKKVPKLGPRAFAQCAGFLRVAASPNPLDHTAVHPESYGTVEKMLRLLSPGVGAPTREALAALPAHARAYGVSRLAEVLCVGAPTLADILEEMEKPGRDPREDMPPPLLRADVLDIADLVPGMELVGTVRNVVDFGAFVDIGVHRNGLVHISRMADRFIRHPSEAVAVGDVVRVWVVEVDAKRERVALSMRKDAR